MGFLDNLTADPGTAQGMLNAGTFGGLQALGAALAQAGALRPMGTPGPTLADAFTAYGTGRQRGLLSATQAAQMQRKMRQQGLLSEARSDKPDDQISPEARAYRGALAGLPEGVRTLADDEQLPGLAIQRETQRQRPMTAAELAAGGFRPGSVVYTSDFTGNPSVVQQSQLLSPEEFNQRARLTAMGRGPTVSWRDERDAAGNLIGQRSTTGQFQPIAAPAINPGRAVTILAQLGPRVADGTIQPGSPEFEQYAAAWAVATEPKTDYVPDPTNPGMLRPVTRPRMMLPQTLPDPAQVLAGRPAATQPPPVQPQAAPPPVQQQAPVAQPSPAVPIPGSGGMTAEPPPVSTLPRAQEGAIRATPQAVEAVRKGEIEAARVADAVENYRTVLKEVSPGFRTWINDPTSPQAQKINAAFERLKMTMRGEMMFNTGVLQPGENVMLEQALLSPMAWRGAVAPFESHNTRLQQIEKQILDSYNSSRKQVGLPPIRSLSGVGAGAAAGVGREGWGIRPAQ